MSNFWDQSNFNFNDQINLEIWRESPKLQRDIQKPGQLTQLGSIGPQQAMLDENATLGINADSVLPWVPDIVGKDSHKENDLLIFGAVYAGFIDEYSSRRECMPLNEYVNAAKDGGLTYFQKLFLERVVERDSAYYGKIKSLIQNAGVEPSLLVLSDLCRNSIVERRVVNNKRRDSSRQPSKERAATYCVYVENEQYPKIQEWTEKRILQSKSGRIIALGHVAEHGLLRLFSRIGATISQGNEQFNLQIRLSPQWVDSYADPNRQLSFWINNKTWWTIKRGDKEWRLLPIYHPATVDRYDSNYKQTASVLDQMLKNCLKS